MKKYLIALGGLAVLSGGAPASAQTQQATTISTPAAASVAPSGGPLAEPQAGFLKSVQGNVQLLSAGAEARPAKAGDPLAAVDRIVTDADGSAGLVLRDGTALVVGPSSRMDLKEFHFDATTQEGGVLVSLLRGSLRMITGLIGKTHPDSVRVETQTATIGVRGTDFIVQTDGQP